MNTDKPLPPTAALAYICGYLQQAITDKHTLTLQEVEALRAKGDASLAAYVCHEVAK